MRGGETMDERAHKAAESAARNRAKRNQRRAKESKIREGLKNIIIDPTSTADQKLEAARLLENAEKWL